MNRTEAYRKVLDYTMKRLEDFPPFEIKRHNDKAWLDLDMATGELKVRLTNRICIVGPVHNVEVMETIAKEINERIENDTF